MKRGKKGRKRVFFSLDHMWVRGTRKVTPEQRLDPLITAVGLPMSHAPLCIRHRRADEL